MMPIILLVACAPAEETGLEGADLLPPCTYADPGDRLQLAEGCADGVCDGMPYSDMVATIGEPERCHENDSTTFCYWMADGLHTLFLDDADGDNVPAPSATAGGIYLEPPWDGTSPEGLGIGVSLACYLDVYGEDVSQVEYREVQGVRNIWEFYVPEIGAYVRDAWTDERLDGLVGELGLYGPS